MLVLPLASAALIGAAAGAAEALAVTRTDRVVPLPGLPSALADLRIAHVSDLHLGAPGVNASAGRRAVGLVQQAEPDLVAITGDLLSHPRGVDVLYEVLDGLSAPLGVFAVLGNHDLGDARDPFARAGAIPDLAPVGVELLRDRSTVVVRDGVSIAVSGIDPHRPSVVADGLPFGWPSVAADLHVVLAHYPDVFGGAPDDARGIVLAGHLHGGQICVPWPSGRVRLSQLGEGYEDGVYQRGALVLHVSRGVGTTLVPFRLFARPEVTIIRLVCA